MRLRHLINTCVLAGLCVSGLGPAQDANTLVRKEHLQMNEETVWSGD